MNSFRSENGIGIRSSSFGAEDYMQLSQWTPEQEQSVPARFQLGSNVTSDATLKT